MSHETDRCCALGICCRATSAKPRKALARILADALGREQVTCLEAAEVVLKQFDLAPKGSLALFKEQILALVDAHPHAPDDDDA